LTELNEIIYAGAHRQPNITGCFMTEWKFKQEGQQICLYGPVAMVFICLTKVNDLDRLQQPQEESPYQDFEIKEDQAVPCLNLQYAFEYLENKFILVTNDKILWFDREACLSAFAIEITH
jgi:hypothetical protein